MGIIYQTNKKTGITYAYENEAFGILKTTVKSKT